ncbi:MAG TPA: AAA family ATPase [Firmicutes bacterium]|jgi:chromosome partitioning protein|nr:AAA family ATPase [Bacillota bacterium]
MESKTQPSMEWTTAQIAARLSVPVATVRYWVRCGLVTPFKQVRHTYLFTDSDFERFQYIHQRRRAKVSIAQIRRELSLFSWQGLTEQKRPVPQDLASQHTDRNVEQTARSPRVLVLANQKGGVGKTTSAINLGAALAEQGYRALIIDWDPQANASQALGLTHDETENGPSVFDCVKQQELRLTEVIRSTQMTGLDLAAANIQLSGLELDLANAIDRESVLRSICDRQPLEYDFVIIDTPPTLGLITVNALVAGEWVVIPVQTEYLSLEGVRQLMHTIGIVRQRLNPALKLVAVLITMHNEAEPLAESMQQRISAVFGERVITTIIPRSVHVVEAQMQGIPIAMHQPESPVTRRYSEVAASLVRLDEQERQRI